MDIKLFKHDKNQIDDFEPTEISYIMNDRKISAISNQNIQLNQEFNSFTDTTAITHFNKEIIDNSISISNNKHLDNLLKDLN